MLLGSGPGLWGRGCPASTISISMVIIGISSSANSRGNLLPTTRKLSKEDMSKPSGFKWRSWTTWEKQDSTL